MGPILRVSSNLGKSKARHDELIAKWCGWSHWNMAEREDVLCQCIINDW